MSNQNGNMIALAGPREKLNNIGDHVPMTTDDIIKTDGGCEADKLKARHKALQDSFTQAALGLMQGTWMPKK